MSAFRTTFDPNNAHLYEPEQANFWAMILRRENARRQDNLSFKVLRSNRLDVALNPLYVIYVGNPANGRWPNDPNTPIQEYVAAIMPQSS